MDSIQAQLQIRQNALEAQEYAQDLLSWQKTIKSKSSSTHNSNSSKQHAQQHPKLPLRGRASGTIPAAPKEAHQPALQLQGAAQQQSHPAAHTYKNYDKWDRFDVDAALKETEAAASSSSKAAPVQPRAAPARSFSDQQQQEGPMTRVINAPAATQTPAGKAATLKDQGNKLFQAKYYDDAISCYTQSIDSQPTAVAYANRAMAYLKLDKFQEAEADCSAAVLLDPSYVKAWHRRGTAHRQMGKLLEAAADFEECLRLEPSNAPVQADRNQALDQHLKQQQIQRSNNWHNIPVKAQPAAGIQVQGQEQASPAQQQQEQPAAAPPAAPPAAAAAANGIVRPVTPVTPSGMGSSKSSSTQGSPQQRQSVAAAAQAAAQQLAARLASSLKAPKTGHEFESAWRSLKGDVQLQGKYLSLLQPQQLPTLFKSSLTAQLLSTLLTAALTAMAQPAAVAQAAPTDSDADALQQLSPAHAVGLIEGLVSVPRFDMMVMSVGSRDKAALKQLWEAAAASADSRLQERLNAVRSKYRI